MPFCLTLRLIPREQVQWLESTLKASRILGDKEAEGIHLGNLGNAYADLGEARKAIEFYEKRIEIAREISDRRGEGKSLGNLGVAYKNLGETRKAIEFYEKALAIASEIDDLRDEGIFLGNLGATYQDLGETRKAIELYEQALAIAREIGDRNTEGSLLTSMAVTCVISGISITDHSVDQMLKESIDINTEIGNKSAIARSFIALGMGAYLDYRGIEAESFYNRAEEIATEIEARPIVALAKIFRSPIMGQKLSSAKALQLAQDAKSAFDEMGMKVGDDRNYKELIAMFERGEFPE